MHYICILYWTHRQHYKIAPVKGTNAYTVVALCKVYAGESVTVSYSNKGYKGYSNEACLCRSCNPSNPPVMAKRMRPTGAESLEEPNRRKKTRRGKRKHKKQPKADGLECVFYITSMISLIYCFALAEM